MMLRCMGRNLDHLRFLDRTMEQGGAHNKWQPQAMTALRWLPIAVAAAFALTDPFLRAAMGASLGLIFLCCDKRPSLRKLAGIALLPLLVISFWSEPLLSFFALTASLSSVWILKRNLFSTVTSSVLVGCLIATILTIFVIWSAGPEKWEKIENNLIAFQQEQLRQLTGKPEEFESDRLELFSQIDKFQVRVLPANIIILMIASFFLSVIIFRHFGESDHHLSLGCIYFNQYRFEDNWIWMVIVGLVVALFFSSNEQMLRIALNILFVMGILYMIRGLAVIFFFIASRNGGLILRILVTALCLTPVVMFHLIFGILDTWIDFRKTVTATR